MSSEERASSGYSCAGCTDVFRSVDALQQHEETSGHNSAGSSLTTVPPLLPTQPMLRCRRCQAAFHSHADLYRQRVLSHPSEENVHLQSEPWTRENVEPPEEYNSSAQVRDAYVLHRSMILAPHRSRAGHAKYNFPIEKSLNTRDLESQMHCIVGKSELLKSISPSA